MPLLYITLTVKVYKITFINSSFFFSALYRRFYRSNGQSDGEKTPDLIVDEYADELAPVDRVFGNFPGYFVREFFLKKGFVGLCCMS